MPDEPQSMPTAAAPTAPPPAGPPASPPAGPPVTGPEKVAPWGPGGPATDAPPQARPGGSRRSRGRLALEWAVVLVVALVVALGVRTYVFETFFIPSLSMHPTLDPGDRIVVDKLSFHLHPVYVGDIVVFKRPPTWPAEYADLVKRVIGLPGETLWVRDDNVFVDQAACTATSPCTGPVVTGPGDGVSFRELREQWLPAGDRNVTQAEPTGSATNLASPYTVPAGEYFVMGDNRLDSADSRYYGPVPRSDLVGEVVFRYWPLGRLGSI